MSILVAILIFTLIIVIHELGHFFLAKKNGIAVTEFSVGMGPRIFTIVKEEKGFVIKFLVSDKLCNSIEQWKDRTKYSLKLFPIGGSCLMLGEDEIIEDKNAFNKKGVWARISVVVAGPIFNFILAFVLAMIIIGTIGYDPAKFMGIEKNMPLSEAGVKDGDLLLSINGEKIEIEREISTYLLFHPLTDKPVTVVYERDGVKHTVTPTPKLSKGKYRLGFAIGSVREKTTPLNVLKYSGIEVKYWIETTLESLKQLVTGKLSKDDIAGPVGVVDMIGTTVKESTPYGIGTVMLSIMNISILLSANLGVMNLLPLPALDGGRLVFLILEVIRKKPVDQEKEGLVHLIGFVALMALMVFVMFNDFSRIFHF